ncbi:MAG: response regulator, partial [Candidatus Cloacimonadota bacterium]|nr:response regulator [Candidatus Cloacimonadota bacterium]
MNLKIAIIDDDKVQLKFIEKVISQVNDFNLDIFTAQTQAGLYKILAKENIDAILCDYYLEGTTGFDIYKQLQLKDINTPFILFSSNENEEIIEKSIKNGVYDFLIKNQISPLSLYKLFYKIVCTVRDNQKHLKTIEEVKALKFLSGKSPTLQMITDDNGNIIFVNKELLTFLNISRNNILDRKYFDVIKDIDFDNSITINEFKDFEESFRKRIRIVHNNKLFHFNLNITEFRINSNKRFFATLDDVTEQNYLLQEFNDTREKLTILSDAVTEGIMLVKDGLIVEHNTQTLSIFNYDKSLIGQRMEKLFPKKSWDEISQKYVDGKEYIFETIGKTNCNKQIFLKIHTKDIRYNNQKHSVVIVRDISKEKSIIKKLQRARQKADRANTAKTDFLAKVTHELRTPLHSIAGFTDILLQGLDGPINNTQKESLSR